MNRISAKLRARRNSFELQRAIDRANTPALRDEIMAMRQRMV